MFYDEYDPIAASIRAVTNGVSQPLSTGGEIFGASVRNAMGPDSTMGRHFELEAIWGGLTEQINSVMGPQYLRFGTEGDYIDFPNPADYLGVVSMQAGGSERRYQWEAQRVIDQVIAYEQANPGSFDEDFMSLMDLSALDERARENALAARDDYMDVIGQARGTGALYDLAGGFVGSIPEITRDPLQLAGMALGGSGNLMRFAFQEAMINAGAEALRQPGLAAWYDELGLEYTFEDFRNNVVASAVAGTTLSVGLRQLGRGLSRAFQSTAPDNAAPAITDPLNLVPPDRLRRALELMGNAGVQNSMLGNMAFNLALRAEDEAALNVGLPASLHNQYLDTTAMALATGRSPEGLPQNAPDNINPALVRPIEDRVFAPNDAPYPFNFARETDEINQRLASIQSEVSELAQGRGSFEALAQASGVEAGAIRSLIDRNLAYASETVRQSQEIMALGDDAFGMFMDGHIAPNVAQMIGRVLGDVPDRQLSAIGVVRALEPENDIELEAILRQVREADVAELESQADIVRHLVTEQYAAERAQIINRAMDEIAEDQDLSATLAQRARGEEGNPESATSQRRAELDGQTIALIQTLANRAGQVSDALSAAAKAARDTGRLAAPTRNFVNAVRRGLADGDFDGVNAGAARGFNSYTPESSRAEITAERSLEGFDEPTGHGAEVENQIDAVQRDLFPEDQAEAGRAADVEDFLDEGVDMDMEIPSPIEGEEGGVTMRQVREMLDEEDRFIERLEYCTI